MRYYYTFYSDNFNYVVLEDSFVCKDKATADTVAECVALILTESRSTIVRPDFDNASDEATNSHDEEEKIRQILYEASALAARNCRTITRLYNDVKTLTALYSKNE